MLQGISIPLCNIKTLCLDTASPSRPQWYRPHITSIRLSNCSWRAVLKWHFHFSNHKPVLGPGLPSATGLAWSPASTSVFVQLDNLTLVQHIPYIITIVNRWDKWGIHSHCWALTKPRVNHHNQVSMTKMNTVAWSLISPNNGVWQYHLRPYAVYNDIVIPNMWCCSSGLHLWKQPSSYSAI